MWCWVTVISVGEIFSAQPPSGEASCGQTPYVMYGGTFDPVHHGHLRTAIEVGERLGVARVYLTPCYLPPHRSQPGASAAQRMQMLQAAIVQAPGLAIDDRELRRDQASYSINTLLALRQELGAGRPLVMVLGSDAFAAIDRWHRWEEIPLLAHLVVVMRPGAAPIEGVAARWLRERAAAGPADLQESPAGRLLVLHLPQLEISATAIRQAVGAGRSIAYWVPASVQQAIADWQLYAN